MKAWCAVLAACCTLAAEAQTPRSAPGTLSPRELPEDPRAAQERERFRASDEAMQVRKLDPKDPAGKGRSSPRQSGGEDKARQQAERDARKVSPEPPSPNRLADPGRSRPLGDDAEIRRRALEDARRRAP